MDTKEFIDKAKKIHGEKYDYSKVVYINPKEKVCIICPKHGEFLQKPYNHLNGQGCGKCRYEMLSNKYKKTTEQWIKEAINVHGNKYDYSKVKYNLCQEKVCIVCPKHGEFWQRPLSHIQGEGCPKCYNEKKIGKNILGSDKFIEKAKIVHGNKYDYSEVKYTVTRGKVKIICPIHGEFEQTPESHLQGKGCPRCGHHLSKAENDIYEYISQFIPQEDIIRRDRTVLSDNKELDIYIPKLKIAIEYNGLRWHSEEFNKDKNYHLNKLEECSKNGIKLIQIFEDEWVEKKDIVLKKLKHILGYNESQSVYARKCIINEVDKQTAYNFLEKNHIQGSVGSSVFLGAYYGDKLVGIMGFIEDSKDKWNLIRFATDNDLKCIGVGGKLFKEFVQRYKPSYVKSFADRRWTLSKEDNIYTRLGFKLSYVLPPDYRYVNGLKREHKFAYRKQKLHRKYGVPLSMTEHEMAISLGFFRIYDCGLFRYEWTNDSLN